jgi:hypothetical protein
MASQKATGPVTAAAVDQGPAERLGGELGISATISHPANQSASRPRLTVYEHRPIGYIEDHGAGAVFAWSYSPDGTTAGLGQFDDRRAARLAIESCHRLGGAR